MTALDTLPAQSLVRAAPPTARARRQQALGKPLTALQRLIDAARVGDQAAVSAALADRAKVTGQNNAALLGAAEAGHFEIVCDLAAAGGDIQANYNYPLQALARHGAWSYLARMVELGSNPQSGGQAILSSAVEAGQLGPVRYLLDNGCHIQALAPSALSLAVKTDQPTVLPVIELLVGCAETGSETAVRGLTEALHTAAREGRFEVLDVLLRLVSWPTPLMTEALSLAAIGFHETCVRRLLDAGAPASLYTLKRVIEEGVADLFGHALAASGSIGVSEGRVLLIEAAGLGQTRIMKLLLDSGVPIDRPDCPALRAAAKAGHLGAVRLLRAEGAEPVSKESLGKFGKIADPRILATLIAAPPPRRRIPLPQTTAKVLPFERWGHAPPPPPRRKVPKDT